MILDLVAASKEAGSWGMERDNHDDCFRGTAQLQYPGINTGCLIRIAKSLERIADLLDPEARRKEAERQKQLEQYELASKNRIAAAQTRKDELEARMEKWLAENKATLDRLGKTYADKVLYGIRHFMNLYLNEGYSAYLDRFMVATSADIASLMNGPVHLYGIGTVTKDNIIRILSTANTVANGD